MKEMLYEVRYFEIKRIHSFHNCLKINRIHSFHNCLNCPVSARIISSLGVSNITN